MSADQRDPDDDLRQRLDEREFLREAEEAAEQLERNTRTFLDVIDAAMLSGDVIELELGSVRVVGLPTATSDSLVKIDADGNDLYVSAGAISVVDVLTGPMCGAPSKSAEIPKVSLLRFLRSLVATQPDGLVELTTTFGRSWRGRVLGVADDHVEFEVDGGKLRACRLDVIATLAVVET